MAIKEVLIGTLGGMAAGFALGLLFAPASGSDTRRKLNQQGEAWVEEFRSKLMQYLDGLTQRFSEGPEMVEEITEQLDNRRKGKRG